VRLSSVADLFASGQAAKAVEAKAETACLNVFYTIKTQGALAASAQLDLQKAWLNLCMHLPSAKKSYYIYIYM